MYSAVYHGSEPLAEFGPARESARRLAQVVIEQVAHEDDRKMSFVHESTFVHYITTGSSGQAPLGLTFLVVADQSVERKAAFLLLLNLQTALNSYTVSGVESMDEVAKRQLSDEVRKLTLAAENGEQDAVGALERELDQIKHVMIANVERILERGERINLLVNKTDRMNANAVAFRKVSAKTRSKFWWDNVKYMVLLIFVLIFLVYLLLGE